MHRKILKNLSLLFLLVVFVSARRSSYQPTLVSVHLVDRNGFTETVSHKERLKQFENVDFFSSQPYQKTLRVYARDPKGNVCSLVNTYHPNGNPKQYLEVINGRAYGVYRQWHENRQLQVSAEVIGGVPDLTPTAEASWLFTGLSQAWDEEGRLLAKMQYQEGFLEGPSFYYHPSGQLWKSLFFKKNQAEGIAETFRTNGELLQQIHYRDGKKEGLALRFWRDGCVASQEEYTEGRLLNGQYFSSDGQLLAEVKEGNGSRALFGETGLQELQEIRQGFPEGQMLIFAGNGDLCRIYHIQSRIKDGEELEFYPGSSLERKKLRISFFWQEGKIQGVVKTWYPNGELESQKEMSNNKKHGTSTVWYQDGNLMMIEEYDQGKLIRGDYFSTQERSPISRVWKGKGTATLFDSKGRLLQKIPYINGRPDPEH